MDDGNSSHGARSRWPASSVVLLLLACPLALADVTITVKGVSAPLRANVMAYLSFARYQKSKSLSADTVERLQGRIAPEVQSALKPFGYFQSTVASSVTAAGPGNWKVAITVHPGPPVILDHVDVRVAGPGADSRLFERITRHLPFHTGQRLDQSQYDSVRGDLLRTAATYGYLDATLSHHELLVNPGAHTASINLELQTGVRYRFGATTIVQHAVREKLVRKYLRYREGEPFDLTEVLRTQFALDDSQYFTNLEVLPGDPDRAQHTVPISIHANPNRPNVYSFAGGYENDTGARGILSWEDRRVNSYGHRMSVDLEAAQVTKYSLQSRYVIPIGDPAVENLTLSGTVIQQELADVDARTMSIGPSITRVMGNWQTVWFVNGVQSTGTVTTSWPGTVNPSNKECIADGTTGTTCYAGVTIGIPTNDMLVPGVDLASVPKGYLGEPMFEHGLFAEIRGSQGAFGSKANFLQIHIELERAFRLSADWHLLLRNELGATAASHFGEMPPAMRFYAGGEGSVRGFEYDGLSPNQKYCLSGSTICAEAQAGGKDVFTGTVEFDRDLPRSFGLALFFDYGNAFNHLWRQEQPVYNDAQEIMLVKEPFLQYGAGVGFLFRLPVLTLGIDVGQPLSQRGSPRLYINFSPKL